MARPLRIEYAGVVYHVMARGNQGRAIYADDRDRKPWLETLGEACQKTGKGTPEKTVLAWWLRQNTVVALDWAANHLGMGHASRVSQAVARMRHRPGRRLKALQHKLAKFEPKAETLPDE